MPLVPIEIQALLILVGLFVAMLGLQSVGRQVGERHLSSDPSGEKAGGVAEGAVLGLLGLFLAFTFSGAGTRFDSRRHLVVEEANAIGTAWLRVDLLPPDAQPAIRDLFRQYLDSRLDTYRLVPDMPAVEAALARSATLQGQIWSASVAAAGKSNAAPPFILLLPALNEMIDITTTRTVSAGFHPPMVVFVMVGILALVGSIFSGYGMAGRKAPSWFHRLGFAAVMTTALYVIIDLEYPRLGLIRIDATDQVLVDVRRSMK
jgi:hypothetical protein